MINEKGFTLIEALIAVSVLAVGIVALLEAFPLGMHLQKSAQMTNSAIQLAQARMEELNALSYGELVASEDPATEDYGFDADFPAFKRETTITLFDPDDPATPPESDLGIKKIAVSVFWRAPLGVTEKELAIANLITRR